MSADSTFAITDPLPSGTTLLEASAGTGKTWTIAALVTRFVAEGHALLPEMLVVTFSRAASQELRARVRAQLVEAERALLHPPALDERDGLITLLLDADEAELTRRRERLRAALTEFDAATIATTHQFCQMVLRSLGVAGDTDSNVQLVEDLDDLLVDVVDDLYLRGFARTGDPVFSRDDALTIARKAVDDSHAVLAPRDPVPGSVAARRVAFAEAVRAEVDRRKRRLGVLHYQDLLTQLAAALDAPESPARDRMRARWRVVLVDEFQDTDPVQWQVLDRAFTGHAVMVLIGDPKQAIYAFRGGDIVTYLEAARSAGTRKTLGTNHRSDAPLVESLQTVLGRARLGDADIDVKPVQAHHEGSRLAGAPCGAPFRLRVMDRAHAGKSGTGTVLVAAMREHVSRDCASEIAALLASGATHAGEPLRPNQIAVLAYRGADLATMQAALADVGVASVIGGGGSVFQTLSATEWLTLLEALVAPHRSARTHAAALTSLIGLTPSALHAGGDDLSDRLSTHIRDLAELGERRGLAAVLERITIQGLAQRVLSRTNGERHLTDLRHVAQLLHVAGTSEAPGLMALTTWLHSQMADRGPAGSSTRTRRLDSDASAVQLVTIHGSKGLQYPVVHLPFLADRWVPKSPEIPLFHDAEDTRLIDVGGEGHPGWRDSVTAHQREDAGESLRLLYVALTRAQSQVVAWWAPGYNTATSALHRMLVGRAPGSPFVPDMFRVPADAAAHEALQQWAADPTTGRAGLHLERADLATAAPPVPPVPVGALGVRTFGRAIDTDWRRTSYTALTAPSDGLDVHGGVGSEPDVTPRDDDSGGHDAERLLEHGLVDTTTPEPAGTGTLPGLALPGADVPSPMADLPMGATFGSLVHAVLEHTDPRAEDLSDALLEAVREQLVAWPVDLGADGAAVLARALVAVLDTPLGPLAPGATLRTIGTDRLCELDFELPLDGGDEAAALDAGATNARSRARGAVTLGDLAPLLRRHLPEGDPVREWARLLAQPALGDQVLRGYLTGSIDVVLRVTGPAGVVRYLVVDYKTNWLGPVDEPLTAAAYGPAELTAAMGHSSYPLQALLYAVVAHRFLRWRLRDYDPEKNLGGVLYLYVRGMCGPDTPVIDGHPTGVFSWRPPVALVEAVSDLLDGEAS
ncbi:UvrD-helicase domain-containing protein [Janibacter sp. G56]|uniref:UvrD-helicase domain-containing protein n=1 Tax=Janibacter sp. G56 TaxID=3418717 RepID=UPI003CFE545F